MAVTLRSYSKINLGLAIGPTRPDGFHALATLYQTLEAHDRITVTVSQLPRGAERRQPVVLTANDRRVPLDGRNTVWKMLALALGKPGRERLQARVHIDKRLPVQGGLGGGSANAAAALLGVEREIAGQRLAEPLSGEERLGFAAEVGSDVPLFLLGGTVLGTGRGEDVVPVEDLPSFPVVLALPEVGVSTPTAFRAWDEQQVAAGLTPEAQTRRLGKLSRALASAWVEQHATGVLSPRRGGLAGTLLSTLVQTGILLNDFEEVVFRQHPLLEQIKCALAGQPASEQEAPLSSLQAYAALSGSGSAVFGLYAEGVAGEADASAAVERLNRLGVRSLRTRTERRTGYWAGMVESEW